MKWYEYANTLSFLVYGATIFNGITLYYSYQNNKLAKKLWWVMCLVCVFPVLAVVARDKREHAQIERKMQEALIHVLEAP